MLHIRSTKTSSGATAIQIVRYENRQKIIMAHIGSARDKTELLALRQTAEAWIKERTGLQSLFASSSRPSSNLMSLDKCEYIGVRYSFIYEILSKLFILFKFHLFHNPLLIDLPLMRIVEPASKLRSLELIEEYFGIHHERRDLYRQISQLAELKEQIESKILRVAKKHFSFDFSLVFYDVTTLYFESFAADDFKKPGFSKDNKHNQPQILIGLMVSKEGFPIAYEIFEGNVFEGHTIIPIITAFQRRHKIKRLTVVADAAMISLDNIKALEENKLNYIVGARTGSLPAPLIESISAQLQRADGTTWRGKTTHGELVCGFSMTRFRKDKREMEKQITKAEAALKDPSKIKRMKFIRPSGKSIYQINAALIEKQQLLLGIKGYYTNLPSAEVDNDAIIKHYHNLWHVEQAFRMAKSDLQIRPIYHFKEHSIKTHVLICFMALAVSKYLELKTGRSIKAIVKMLKSVTDARILNTLTNKEIVLKSKIGDDVKELLQRMGLWY